MSTPSSHSSPIEGSNLNARLDRLEARIDKEEKSLLKRFGAWGGLIALLISITAGFFGLYDSFILRPERERQSAGDELRRIVERITELNSKIIELQLAGDPLKASTFAMNSNGEKGSLLQRADELVVKIDADVSCAEYVVLSWEHLQFADGGKALEYAEHAASEASNDAYLAEAHRYRGLALFLGHHTSDEEKGRDAFEAALALAQTIGTPLGIQIQVNVLRDWIGSEAQAGSCDRSQRLYMQMTEMLTEAKASADIIAAAKGMIDHIDKANVTCDIVT